MAGNKRKVTKTTKINKKQKVATTKPEKEPEKAPITNDSDSDLSEPEPAKIQKLLEPYTKDQLIEFLCDAAETDSSLVERIQSMADQDVSHRKVFVHGLGWNTTRETLLAAFDSYGAIEDCTAVVDKATGKCKGYGFVTYKSRAAAAKALKQPQKNINNRMTHCQLASEGPVAPSQFQDNSGRKIYVSNVHPDVNREKLRDFFSKFGEIETGPLGFDLQTGKSRGFALFVYKTYEGAKKALDEPYKMFEGHQLHCQRASENKNKTPALPQQQQQNMQPPVLAAVAAAQNLAIFGQHPSLNPVYGGLMVNPNAGLVAGSVNPLVAGALNPSTQLAGSSVGTSSGLGGYGASHGLGILGGNPSMYGAYGGYGAFGSINSGLQGVQSYQASNLGQSSSSRNNAAGGSYSGYPSYMG